MVQYCHHQMLYGERKRICMMRFFFYVHNSSFRPLGENKKREGFFTAHLLIRLAAYDNGTG